MAAALDRQAKLLGDHAVAAVYEGHVGRRHDDAATHGLAHAFSAVGRRVEENPSQA